MLLSLLARVGLVTSEGLKSKRRYAIVIVFLIPLALRGVRYRPLPAARLLRDNLLLYGVGGLIVPFIGIKAIDMLLAAIGVS